MIPTALNAAKTPTGAATLAAFRAPLQQAGGGAGGAASVLPGPAVGALPGRIQLLLDPTEQGPALLEAVLEARTSLKLDAAWLLGPWSGELLPAVARRARMGLRVQVLGLGLGAEALAHLRAHGLVVRSSPWMAAQGASVGRIFVADDRVAFVGGAALRTPVVSALTRLSGEAASELGRFFNHDWAAAGGAPLPLAPVGAFQASGTHALRSMVALGGVGPSRRALRSVLMAAVAGAQRELLVVADALGDGELVAALVAAAQRGLKVQVLLGAAEGLQAVTRQAHLAKLAAAGAELREAAEGGVGGAVALRAIAVDGQHLVVSSAAFQAKDLAAAGEVALDARGGQEPELAVAALALLFERGLPLELGASLWSVAAPLAPLVAAFGAKVRQAARAVAAGWQASSELGVGVQHVPGGTPKLVARRLPPRPKASQASLRR